MSVLAEHMQFNSRDEFRNWLKDNCMSSGGVWLLFGKPGGPKTITANEALEEALCFGWIDGQMQSIDDKTYIKYFSVRRKNSKWSDKNKAIAQKLETNVNAIPSITRLNFRRICRGSVTYR